MGLSFGGKPRALKSNAPVGVIDIEDRPPAAGGHIIKIVGFLIVVFLAWAGLTTLEEVTRGDGRIIPSSKMQVIQSAEPGVVREILVREGQRVEKGAILARIDNTLTSSGLGELTSRAYALEAATTRLRLEYERGFEASYVCPPEILKAAPNACANEQNLRTARRLTLQSQLRVLTERIEAKKRELSSAQASLDSTGRSLTIARDEMALISPLAKSQVVAATDLLRTRRDVSELEGRQSNDQEAIARIQAELREADLQLEGQSIHFRQEALAELTQKQAELAVVRESMRAAADRVANTDMRSPVSGIVNTLYINTVGGFVNAGTRVMDIVPVEEQLLVEAKVRPQDIAFIHPGQRATVKVTAYDFSIYGGLDGEVEQVSASSVYDEASRETFYTVLVKTGKSTLARNGVENPILPGMITTVDILTGEKSVLNYLLKPINKARAEALRER
jgi:membrane fusion protein, adhesin transport system